MSHNSVPSKDPDNEEPFFFVWCDRDGTNDGGTSDDGDLQGAQIASYTVTVPSGITKASDNKSAVTIHGVNYVADTVVTVWLSGGTVDTDYEILCEIVTDEATPRTLRQRMTVPVRYG